MITADQILPPGADQTDRPAWLAARRTGIGSSDVSAILGMNTYKSARHIYLDKIGQGEDEPQTEAARWGVLLEPVVRGEFSHRTGVAVSPLGLHRSREHPHMLYSADGITSDGGLYEGKTQSLWLREQWEGDQVPDHAELQVQHGMAVMGVDHAWVAGLIGGQKLVWQRIARDDELIAMLIKQETEFWLDHVLCEVPPPLDGSDAATEWVRDRFPSAAPGKRVTVDAVTAERLLADYRKAGANKKADEAAYKAAQNAFREHVGDAEELATPDGRIVATWRHTGTSFDEELFAAEHPELAARYTRLVPQLDVAALRRDEPAIATRYRNRVLSVKTPKGK